MNRTHQTLLLLCLLIFIASCQLDQSEDKTSKALTHELQKVAETGSIHGFSVAIVSDKGILYQKGFGFADVQHKKSYTIHSIQKVGSVSKVIIGLALLKAQELGKLNLDDPINKYLAFDVSNPSFPDENITLRHLAHHSSSITDTKFYDENVYVLKDDKGFNGIEEMKGVFKPAATQLSMSEFLEKLLSKD